MATGISRTSTPQDIENIYLDNCGYDAAGSVTMCQAFIAACRAILIRRPMKATRGAADSSQEMQWDVALIRQELTAAVRWLAFAPAANNGGVIHADLTNTRDQGGWANDRPYGTDV